MCRSSGGRNDNIQAGNGDNEIVGGLGQHPIQVDSGSNILIDGSVLLTRSGGPLQQVLDDWISYGATASDVASIRSRLAVTYNSSYANTLHAGSGLDWFLLSAEDDLADTIRLGAAGADVSRIHALTLVRSPQGGEVLFNLKDDLARLEDAIKRVADVRLVSIDPVTAYLGGSDDNRNGDIRAVLAPLAELAARLRVAVLLVTHMNKATGLKAIYRATGSLAFVAVARTVWLVARHPEDPDRRLMLSMKNNLAPESTGLSFRVEGGAVRWDPMKLNFRKAA